MPTPPNKKISSPGLQELEPDVKRQLQDARNAQEFPESKLKEKLDKIRRLGQQNRTLLEHSLFFLQQLFQQVLDRDPPLHLYNLNGHNFQSDLGGGILETRI